MIKHFNIRVSGKVQGVFFRASAVERATALGISGFVRNERDGSVYIEAEGDLSALEHFVAWCRKGPPSAKVSECLVGEKPVSGFDGFVIRR